MNNRKTNYTSPSQQRLLSVIVTLAGNELMGLSPKQVADGISAAPSAVIRDLDNLRSAGFAEQIPETGRWRLGPRQAQIGLAVQLSIESARKQATELENRYIRTST